MALLRPIVEDLGFMMGLASLEHNVSGCAEDNGGGYYNRGRWDHDEDEDETPGMLEVNEKSTKISGLVDLDGVPLLSVGEIHLEDDCLIPKDPFEDEDPDDTDYEGYMGNVRSYFQLSCNAFSCLVFYYDPGSRPVRLL